MPVTLTPPGTRTVTIGGVTFTVRHEQYFDIVGALQFNQVAGFQDQAAVFAGANHMLIQRIVAWDGVLLPNGEPAECTETNKMALFGTRPDLLHELSDALEEEDETNRKNSGPSQSG